MTAKTPRQILTEALAKLGPNGEHWTQNAYARDSGGFGTQFDDPDACKWCAYGACLKAADGYNDVAASLLQESVPNHMKITIWNDFSKRTFPEIRTLFEAAIERAEA